MLVGPSKKSRAENKSKSPLYRKKNKRAGEVESVKRILLDGSLSRANEEKMWAADWGNLLHVNPQLLSLLFIQEVSFSFGDGAGVI